MPSNLFNDEKPLYLERISYRYAKRCVREWHYSKKCTTAMANYVVWERDTFRGVVMFSQGAASCIAKPFGLNNDEVRELVRVALDKHDAPTSKIVGIALRLFRKEFPAVKAVVSFADTEQGHNGTIYQAGNWLYLGSKSYHAFIVNGKTEHPKSLHTRYGIGGQSLGWLKDNVDADAQRVTTAPKHKYLYCFDERLRQEWQAKALPYPRCWCNGSTANVQLDDSGSTPTTTLSNKRDEMTK